MLPFLFHHNSMTLVKGDAAHDDSGTWSPQQSWKHGHKQAITLHLFCEFCALIVEDFKAYFVFDHQESGCNR